MRECVGKFPSIEIFTHCIFTADSLGSGRLYWPENVVCDDTIWPVLI